MRIKSFLILFLFASSFIFAQSLEFKSPTLEDPHYSIIFQLSVEKEDTIFKEIRVNNRKWDYLLAFREGKRVNLTTTLVPGDYEFILDYAWKSEEDYEVLVFLQDSEETKEVRLRGKSPEGGIPSENEGFYRIFIAEETAGFRRERELASVTFTVPRNEFEKESFVIHDGKFVVDYQILDVRESAPPENVRSTHPDTLTFKLVFPVDITPLGKKMYLFLKGKAESELPEGFSISGQAPGKTVKNKHLCLEFHPQSGQINVIETDEAKLFNPAGVIHWNPGVYIPGIAWDHSFNWNPPPSYEEVKGKLLYSNSRRGPLQRIKDITLEVRYTLYAYKPYFISESMIRVEKDLGLVALRNDEMVLSKELFDTLVYREKKGKMVKMPLKEKPHAPYGLVHVAPDNLDWVGLLNTEKNYGFFSLRINYANSSFAPSGCWLHKSGTYFYAPSEGKYVYWVRPLLYTWAEFLTGNLLTFIPAGSNFYEKNAYLVLPLKKKVFEKNFAAKLDLLLKKLRNPVRIY